jgi:hypothetical protein
MVGDTETPTVISFEGTTPMVGSDSGYPMVGSDSVTPIVDNPMVDTPIVDTPEVVTTPPVIRPKPRKHKTTVYLPASATSASMTIEAVFDAATKTVSAVKAAAGFQYCAADLGESSSQLLKHM